MPAKVGLPPCATWNIWKGPEIEGTDSIGVQTLFIRSLSAFPGVSAASDLSFLRKSSKCSRVWFCKEFKDWPLLEAIAKHFDEVCVEVEPKCYVSVPKRIKKRVKIYLKVVLPEPLKEGDFICVGEPFRDEAFKFGAGASVCMEQYLKDIKIN